MLIERERERQRESDRKWQGGIAVNVNKFCEMVGSINKLCDH